MISELLRSTINVDAYPARVRGCLPLLLASLVYHYEFLDKNLGTHDRLRSSRVWTSGSLTVLKGKVLIVRGRCVSTGMTATGIPPHIVQALATTELKDTMIQQSTAIRNDIGQMPELLSNEILGRFQVNGAVPVTAQGVQAMLTQMQNQIVAELGGRGGGAGAGIGALAAAPPRVAVKWLTWHHPSKGRFCSVPPYFSFPKTLTIKPCWDLYLHGNAVERIRPFRLIEPQDMANHKDQCRLSNMKVSCRFILTHVAETHSNVLEMSEAETDVVFAETWPKAAEKLANADTRREKIRGELCMTTVYKLILKQKKAAGQNEEDEE
jgi:hypothetical protein